jgi:hypothetical protein
VGIVVAALLLSSPAAAGPPLIADDPNTIGPGFIQPIFSASVLNQGDETLVRGPIVDLTVGLVDSLDATLVVSLVSLHDAASSTPWSFRGSLIPGVKWQFFRTERGSLAFSPAFLFNTEDPDQPGALLPFQGELKVGTRGSVIGFDVGYVPFYRATDEWFVAPYANCPATPRLNVLFEVWSLSTSPLEITDVGGSVGIDFGIIGQKLRLISAVSTAFVSIGGPRLDVRGYLGAQLTVQTRRGRSVPH